LWSALDQCNDQTCRGIPSENKGTDIPVDNDTLWMQHHPPSPHRRREEQHRNIPEVCIFATGWMIGEILMDGFEDAP